MNPNLDMLTTILTLIVMVEAMGAVVFSVWAAIRGMPEGQVARWCCAALALLHVGAYAVLLFSTILPATWGTVLRGVGVVTWPVAWCWPAATSVRQRIILRTRVARGDE